MDEVKKYWRDKVIQLLGWGTAALVTVSGWSVTQSERFEIGPWAGNTCDTGNVIRAVALLLFAVVFALAWFGAVTWIYSKHLSQDTDDTVLPWTAVKIYVVLVSALLLIVSGLVALG